MKNYTAGKPANIQQNVPLKRLLPFLIIFMAVAAVVVAQSTSYRIFIIGDSTVCDYAQSKYPMTGWGQVFSKFFMAGSVTVNNRAIGARSTKLFYVEGRWTTVAGELKPGDFVFIQFGHNDRDYSKEERYADTNTYKSYLRRYVSESREKGAIPVFVTPMNMNTWNGTTVRRVFTEYERGADYCGAMKNVAGELNVPVIDLEAKSAKFMESVKKPYLDSYHYMGLQPGEYPNYKDGSTDVQTHFQEMGALINARMVAEGIRELSSHAEVGKLAEVLAPLHKVTVTPNKSNTGLVTVSGDFPAGVTITVKVMPTTGETFQNWADGAVSNVSSKKLYMFTMPATPVTMYALFKGGDQVDALRKHPPVTAAISHPRLRISTENHILYISSATPVTGVTLYDFSGRTIIAERYPHISEIAFPLHQAVTSKHILEIATVEEIFRQPISVP